MFLLEVSSGGGKTRFLSEFSKFLFENGFSTVFLNFNSGSDVELESFPVEVEKDLDKKCWFMILKRILYQ